MSFILTLSGMSTSGKTTLASLLSKTDAFDEAVSVTTRAMRAGEVDGKDYHFVSQETFDRYVADGVLVEHVASHSACYGVPKFEVERIRAMGRSVIMVLEPEGVSSINRIALESGDSLVSAFIHTDNTVLMERFFRRITSQEQSGKAFDPKSEANRLHTMLTQERGWMGRWDWDMTFLNLHQENRLDDTIRSLVAMHDGGSTFLPVPKALRPAAKLETYSKERLAELIEIQHQNPATPAEFFKAIMQPMVDEQKKIRYDSGCPSPSL